MRFEVTDQSGMEAIDRALHDRWIDVSGLEQVGVEVRIPVTRAPEVKPSARHFTHVLTLAPVSSFVLEDTEGIGYYDVHSLAIDAARRRLSFRFNIPLRLDLALESLPLVLEITEVRAAGALTPSGGRPAAAGT